MPDRVRESVFSMLGSHYGTPGLLPPIHVADVFAGSGSMGIEALSRGAATCRFFERGRAALAALRCNIESVGLDFQTHVIRRNAWRAPIVEPDETAIDLVFLDPPYADALDTSASGNVRKYLDRLTEWISGEGLVVLHHPKKVSYALPVSDPWRVTQSRSFGSNGITMFQL